MMYTLQNVHEAVQCRSQGLMREVKDYIGRHLKSLQKHGIHFLKLLEPVDSDEEIVRFVLP